MANSYYIYYRVRPDRATEVRSAVAALQRRLAERAGISGRLLCRRDESDTWMEVYENVPDPDTFESVLAEETARLGFAEALGAEGRRVTEVFRPL